MHFLAFIFWVCCLRARQFDKSDISAYDAVTEAVRFKRSVEIFAATLAAAIDRVFWVSLDASPNELAGGGVVNRGS